MPGRWVGGPGSLACPQRGQFIEAKVFDDNKEDQGTIFLEVKRLFGTGSSGRTILGDLVTATDEYYRYWAASPEGIPSTVDGNYHLCRGDPRSCVGGAAGTVVVHLGKWRTWSEDELADGKVPSLSKEAAAMMSRYFKVARTGDPEKKPAKSGLPWGEGQLNIDRRKETGPEKEKDKEGGQMKAKKARITAMEKELRALKAEVEKEEVAPPKRSRSRKPRDKRPGRTGEEIKKKEAFDVKGLRGEESSGDVSSGETDEEKEDGSSSEEEEAVRKEAREKKKEIAKKAKGKKKVKKKDKVEKKKKKDKKVKDRGPFGMAATEEWEKETSSKEDSSDSDASRSGSSFQKAPSLTSCHMKLVRYAKRRPGRLAARLLKKMEKSTGFGGAENKSLKKTARVKPVAHMYFLAIMTPALQAKWTQRTQRTQRELKVATTLLDLVVEGKGAEAGDILAQRIKALEKSAQDSNQWRKAKHLELVEADDAALVDPGEEEMMAKEAEREDKTRRGPGWSEQEPWRKGRGKGARGPDPRRKGSDAKGKGKKGTPAERIASRNDDAGGA